MFHRVVAAAACVVLLIGCGQNGRRLDAPTVLTAPSSVAMKAVDVKFFASMTGGVRYVSSPQCQGLATAASATGTALHMGDVAFEAQQCMNPRTGVGVGTFVLTAANGDQLRGTLIVQSSTPGAVGSEIHITATYTFDGGTGRFEDATGAADVTAVVTQASSFPWPGRWEWNGTVRY